MSELLYELAEKLGVCKEYSYFCDGRNQQCIADDDLLRFIIEDLGYVAGDDEEIMKSLERLDKKRWQRAMEAIYVCQANEISFDIVLKRNEFNDGVKVFVAKEGNQKYISQQVTFEEKEVSKDFIKVQCNLLNSLEFGYYDLKVATEKKEYHSVLAVAPQMCYEIDKKGKEKLFGFAIQLYSLKSKHNWGVGDFTDLGKMVDLTAQSGGDVIGVNPLNVLHHNYPENASPYASISRLFLNPIYIDVEAVPLFQKEDKDEILVEKARNSENIDYTAVYTAKIRALRAIYERVQKNKNSDYAKEFAKFKDNDSGELYRLAVFQVIAEEKFKNGGKLPKTKGEDLSLAMGSGVGKFAEAHADEIDFFEFLQFEADRQLKEVDKKIKAKKLAIGLYRDLPVGVSKESTEVWGDKYLYIQKCGAGAPPDSYFPTGQKWGLATFNPQELKERCYKPYIKILRANMKYAGAIRIDHIMGLSRLFIIPDKGEGGTYIRYNSSDMMNILALESYLNKCAVVGECIGNVADGYAESLIKRGIYLLGVLWSERKDANGTMKEPEEYEEKYFASVGTHDMPPLRAWWFGREIATMQQLGFYNQKETENAYHWREHERRLLLNGLDKAGTWPEDKCRCNDYIYGENFPEGIDEAVHGYMAKTKSEVFMLMPEDIFNSEKIQNLPGTDIDKFPNWRAKQIVDVEDMKDSEMYQRHIKAVKKWR